MPLLQKQMIMVSAQFGFNFVFLFHISLFLHIVEVRCENEERKQSYLSSAHLSKSILMKPFLPSSIKHIHTYNAPVCMNPANNLMIIPSSNQCAIGCVHVPYTDRAT